MSRRIQTSHSHMNETEKALRNTDYGKIIFTEYQEKMCALYLSENRLLAAQVMPDTANRIGAIYIGKVKNVVKNIDACFLEIAGGEICFLSKKDATAPILLNRPFDGRILEGDELLVQVSREAQKTKQASVTADISLSNEYAVISLGSRRIGYSGKIEKTRKQEMKEWLIQAGLQKGNDFTYSAVDVASADMSSISLGLVVRTQANDCTKEELLRHILLLQEEFRSMIDTARHRTCFSCIRQAPEDFEAVLNQLAYPYEYRELLTDDAVLYGKLCRYCGENLPDKTVRLYEDSTLSLSKLYSLEQKLDTALNKRVWLKSGGYLIIEPTEALTVIDVNTGKYDAKRASSETFEQINREAAEEIALQLRLRNLSGIILVDFINMASKESEESLLEFFRALVRKDRTKTVIVDMTPLGLIEITRKKQNKPLREQFLEDK